LVADATRLQVAAEVHERALAMREDDAVVAQFCRAAF
jgi:hypothetical protein